MGLCAHELITDSVIEDIWELKKTFTVQQTNYRYLGMLATNCRIYRYFLPTRILQTCQPTSTVLCACVYHTCIHGLLFARRLLLTKYICILNRKWSNSSTLFVLEEIAAKMTYSRINKQGCPVRFAAFARKCTSTKGSILGDPAARSHPEV